jgi:hypothetical protein
LVLLYLIIYFDLLFYLETFLVLLFLLFQEKYMQTN